MKVVTFILSQIIFFISTYSFPYQSTVSMTTRKDSIVLTSSSVTKLAGAASQSQPTSVDNERPKIRWGIIGLGDVCTKKSGPAFYKCDGSELVAVMRRTTGMAKAFAKTVPGGKCVGYEDIDAFLQHPSGLDVVYVSTRPGTHLEICTMVASAGIACYVEKPVGRCALETERISKIFKEAGLPLYTAYISRAYEKTQSVRKLLQDGAIGDVLTKVTYKLRGSGGARDIEGVDLPWRFDSIQSGGGLLMDVGCHVVDRIDYICGPLIEVKGNAHNKCQPRQGMVEDYVHLSSGIGSSAWAAIPAGKGSSVECTWDFSLLDDDSDNIDELQFEGPKGSIKMAGNSPAGSIQIFDSGGKKLRELVFSMPEHTAQSLIQAITNDLRGLGKSDVLSYGENAIRTQKVLDTCLSSFYGGREIGYWNRHQS